MGWIKRNLAKDKGVKSVIVAKKVDEKLKYATSIIPDISLFEYELNFKIREVSIKREEQQRVTLVIPLRQTSFIYTDSLYMSQVNMYAIKGVR